jgi:uncharacterized protein (TIGR03089 family)
LSSPPATPEGLFDALLGSAASRPFVTYYDEATGERSELSAKSLANWVAKTHFLLTDELGLGVGDRALIALPAHWISVPIVLGCLSAGLELTTLAAGATVAFIEPSAAALAAGIDDIYSIAPAAAAFGLRGELPAGVQDYVLAVRPQGDLWSTVRFAAGPGDPAWDGFNRADIVAVARSRAGDLGLTPGARVLTARDWDGPSAWIDTLFAPLALGGSVVYVRNAPDESLLARRAEQENAVRLPD